MFRTITLFHILQALRLRRINSGARSILIHVTWDVSTLFFTLKLLPIQDFGFLAVLLRAIICSWVQVNQISANLQISVAQQNTMPYRYAQSDKNDSIWLKTKAEIHSSNLIVRVLNSKSRNKIFTEIIASFHCFLAGISAPLRPLFSSPHGLNYCCLTILLSRILNWDHALLYLKRLLIHLEEPLVGPSRNPLNLTLRLRCSFRDCWIATSVLCSQKISNLSLVIQSPVDVHTWVMCIQESFLNPDIADSNLSIDNFTLSWQDRVLNEKRTKSSVVTYISLFCPGKSLVVYT